MFAQRTKHLLYGLLCLGGMASLAFASYQQHYSRLVAAGHRAVAEHRFDSQAYEQASRLWLARQDTLIFNRGVMAYQAANLPRAAQYFRQVSEDTGSQGLRMQALHNLGMVMLSMQQAQGAAELFKAALRLEPQDPTTKFQLERLYHFALRPQGEYGEAALKQAPGAGEDQKPGQGKDGHGRGQSKTGI